MAGYTLTGCRCDHALPQRTVSKFTNDVLASGDFPSYGRDSSRLRLYFQHAITYCQYTGSLVVSVSGSAVTRQSVHHTGCQYDHTVSQQTGSIFRKPVRVCSKQIRASNLQFDTRIYLVHSCTRLVQLSCRMTYNTTRKITSYTGCTFTYTGSEFQ